MMPAGARRPVGPLAFAGLLAGLATLGPFSIDTYMPSFPAMAAQLGVTALDVQQTLSAYLLAFAVMMLFHGALSDARGRRPVILVSLAVYTLASGGCAVSITLPQLLLFRALQGLSAGAGCPSSQLHKKVFIISPKL